MKLKYKVFKVNSSHDKNYNVKERDIKIAVPCIPW